jgi:hypothetical protein
VPQIFDPFGEVRSNGRKRTRGSTSEFPNGFVHTPRLVPAFYDPPNADFHLIAIGWEMRIAMRIRVTTRADLFEERKRQHVERGYRIEDERPTPVNGLCSFIAVSEMPESDGVGALVAEALNGMAR